MTGVRSPSTRSGRRSSSRRSPCCCSSATRCRPPRSSRKCARRRCSEASRRSWKPSTAPVTTSRPPAPSPPAICTMRSESMTLRTQTIDGSWIMAKGENPVLSTVLDINAVSLERTELDPQSLILIRLAALIAVDAPVSSYLLHLGAGAQAGLTLEQAQDVLVAVAPIAGTPRTAAAAAKLAEALGLAIDIAESELGA